MKITIWFNILLIRLAQCVAMGSPAGGNPVQKQLIYSINEESEVGSFVGNLRLDAERKLMLSDRQLKRFELYEETSPNYFRVDSENGKLFVASRIDREHLCPQQEILAKMTDAAAAASPDEQESSPKKLAPQADACELNLALLIGQDHWINVIVKVRDINDHQPHFPTASSQPSGEPYVVEVPESVSIGHEIPLISAKDEDSGSNGMLTYSLRGADLDATRFSISHTPPFTLNLVVMAPVDAEVKSNYTGELVACDAGVPIPKCGAQPIVVRVTDVNDNRPEFVKSLYEVRVQETLKPGTTVLKLEATDADSGLNGRVRYRFRQPLADSVPAYFRLDENTGELRIREALDAKYHSRFIVPVLAEDMGSVPLVSHALVQISVDDVNDHAPWIDFRGSNNPEQADGEFVTSVLENQPNGTSVGLVITGDEDIGENSQVDCELVDHDPNFVLEHTNSVVGRKMYRITTKKTFDRESIPSGSLLIRVQCMDHGMPPQRTIQNVTVLIMDVNEFTPEFPAGKRAITIHFEEGQPPGTPIFRAEALDLDALPEIRYFISREAQPLFHIESESGLLTSRIAIDREETPVVRFSIYAIDKNGFELEGKASVSNVTMIVTDINDNAPTLTGMRQFEIVENRPGFSDLIGQVTAVDRDSGENATIVYHLLSVFGNGVAEQNDTFMLDNQTGKLFALKRLDREQYEKYTLHVVIADLGTPNSLNVTETIIVNVLDENDNAPAWTGFTSYVAGVDVVQIQEVNNAPFRLPGLMKVNNFGVLNFTGYFFLGQRLGQVVATDPDELRNANLTYNLMASYFTRTALSRGPNSQSALPHNQSDLLSLDRSTGELTIGNRFNLVAKEGNGLIEVYFRVTDNGNPPLEAVARMFLWFTGIFPDSTTVDSTLSGVIAMFQTGNYHWLLLVVLFIVILSLVCICLLVALATTRRGRNNCCTCFARKDPVKTTGTPGTQAARSSRFGPQAYVEDGFVIDGQLSVLGKLYQTANTNEAYLDRGSLCGWNGDYHAYNLGPMGSPTLYPVMAFGSTLDRRRADGGTSERSDETMNKNGQLCLTSIAQNHEAYPLDCTLSPNRQNSRAPVNRTSDQFQTDGIGQPQTFSKCSQPHRETGTSKEQRQLSEADGGSADSGRGASEDEPSVLENWRINRQLNLTHSKTGCCSTSADCSKVNRIAPQSFFNHYSEFCADPTLITPTVHTIGSLRSHLDKTPLGEPTGTSNSNIDCAVWKAALISDDQFGKNNPKFEDLPLKPVSKHSATLPLPGMKPSEVHLAGDTRSSSSQWSPTGARNRVHTLNRTQPLRFERAV